MVFADYTEGGCGAVGKAWRYAGGEGRILPQLLAAYGESSNCHSNSPQVRHLFISLSISFALSISLSKADSGIPFGAQLFQGDAD